MQKDVNWPIGWPVGGYPGPQVKIQLPFDPNVFNNTFLTSDKMYFVVETGTLLLWCGS
jgi:hypothetical protein